MSRYYELVDLCDDFRRHAEPDFTNGPADYTEDAMSAQAAALPEYRKRLEAIDTSSWPVTQLVDYEIVRGEMNGMEFDHRVLKPWKRNPSFYSVVKMEPADVPADEIAHVSDVLRHHRYEFPLSNEAKQEYARKLQRIPGLLDQAKGNLTEDTKTLYFLGIRSMHGEAEALGKISGQITDIHPDLVPDVEKAKAAVVSFGEWLQKRHRDMQDSHDGIGVDAFNWCMANVHFVPFTWKEQRDLILHELERGWTSMVLEEQRNHMLPQLEPAVTEEEAQERSTSEMNAFLTFMGENIFTMADYMSLTAGPVDPGPLDGRHFFLQCLGRDYMALRCHMIHYLELQREEHNVHPIRRRPPMYNLWAYRSEGLATAFEETMLQTGFLDVKPRAREIVYVLVAFRAARALGGMMLQSRDWTLQQAIDYSATKTPRGWVNPEGGVILDDLSIYLQQPEYGPSYLTGKAQFEGLMAECAYLRGDKFNLKSFMDEYFSLGTIPASLVRWEMTGKRESLLSP